MKLEKYAKYLGVITLAVALTTACSSSTSTDSSDTMAAAPKEAASQDNAAIEKVIADAKAELKVAEKGGYAWRDTGKMIKKAEAALAKGDTKKAMSLAKKALEQSHLAKQQRDDQIKLVKERFSKS